MSTTHAWRQHLLAAGWLALAIGAAYANVLQNGFVWDDVTLVEQDERIRSLDHVGEIFAQDFFEHSNEQVKYGYYRPLVTLSYLLDHALWGSNPLGYHLTNLLLHWLACLALYALALGVFAFEWDAALVAALAFALHPVHVESVTWISGRTDVLATVAMLAAWWLHGAAERQASAVRRRGLLVASAGALLLALLAKELALVLPLLLLGFSLGRRRPREALVRVVPHALAVTVYLLVRFALVRVEAGEITERPLLQHLVTAVGAFWRYVGELFWPFPLHAYLQHPWVEPIDAWAWLLGASALVPLALLVVCWRRRWLFPFSLLLGFGVSLLPHAGIVRLSGPRDMGLVMAERFLYFPSIFFCIALGALVFAWPRVRIASGLAVLALSVAAATAVARRNPDWRDDGTLMRATLRHAPEAALLHSRLGVYQSLRGEHAAAVRSFRAALDLHRRNEGGESPPLVLDLAAALRHAGDLRGALALLEPLVQLGYDPPPVLYNFGETLRLLGRDNEARETLETCVKVDPKFVAAHFSLSRLEAKSRHFDEALAHYDDAHAVAGGDVSLLLWGGDLQRMRGDLAAAERTYQEALKIDPRFARAEGALGAVAAERGDSAAARKRFERALSLEPDLHDARVSLAVLHARAGELDEAAAELDLVLDRAPGNVSALLTQSLVYWHQGKIPEARDSAAQALRRDPGNARALQLIAALARPGAPPGPQESLP